MGHLLGSKGDAVVGAEVAPAVVVGAATVVGGVGVVPPLQEWIRPTEASSAFLQAEKLPRQLSLDALMVSKLDLALQLAAFA